MDWYQTYNSTCEGLDVQARRQVKSGGKLHFVTER